MSHSPSSHRPPADVPDAEEPAVKSALKATLLGELAEEASRSGAAIGGMAAPEHLAGPGRLRTALRS
jgi:hypothetical protein